MIGSISIIMVIFNNEEIISQSQYSSEYIQQDSEIPIVSSNFWMKNIYII